MSHSFALSAATTTLSDFDEPTAGSVRPGEEADTSSNADENSVPRLGPVWKGDDEDVAFPEVLLRRSAEEPMEPVAASAPLLAHHRNFRTLLIGSSAAGGLLVLMAGGLLFFASDPRANPDGQVVSVKTVPIEGKTSVVTANRGKADALPASASTSAVPALDKADFKSRFNSATEANNGSAGLQEKIQDRLENKPAPAARLASQAEDRPNSAASTEYRKASLNPLLGYASFSSAPRSGSTGQRAIASITKPVSQTPADAQAIGEEKPVEQASVTPSGPSLTDGPLETVTVSMDVHLRGTAVKDGPIIGVVPKGAAVKAGNCDRWWCAVVYDGKSGFVGKKFVESKD